MFFFEGSLTLQCDRFTNDQRYQWKILTLMIWNLEAAGVAALLNNLKMLLVPSDTKMMVMAKTPNPSDIGKRVFGEAGLWSVFTALFSG